MRKILLTLLSFAALSALVACGGGSSGSSVPSNPSTGNNVGFSNSSLRGTYVFSASGFNSANYNFDMLGVFTTDGNGNVTSGYRNVYTDKPTVVQETVTGTYSVNSDGRGQLILNGNSGKGVYRFVMQSPTTASFFQFSSGADDTGRIQLQSTIAFPAGTATLAGTYVIRLLGEDSSLKAYGAVGGITFAGTSVSGTVDQNDDGTLSAQLATSGSLTAADGTGKGTLSLTLSGVTHNFIYYFVSANHIELVGTDGYTLSGYADLQTSIAGTTAAFAGDQVFSVSGQGANGSLLETGRLTLDGAGNVTNAIEDYSQGANTGSYFGGVAFSGTYTAAANGRWTATIGGSLASNLIGWQVSPQQSVVLAWNTSSTIVETGTMRAQNTAITTASITGPYAANLAGFNYNNLGYVELGGNFDATAGSLSGTIDSQTPGYYNTDIATSGQYSIAANGRSPNANVAGVSVVMYTVDANTIYLISSDATRQYQGKMLSQQP